MDGSRPASGTYDVQAMLHGLDRVLAEKDGPSAVPYLDDALAEARALGDEGAALTILNEIMGLHRSLGSHERSLQAADDALALVSRLGADGTDAHATTLINAATARRAAGDLDAARDTYAKALAISHRTMPPGDRRLAALHNNLSMLHSEAGDPSAAHDELVKALAIIEQASVDPGRDIDVAGTLTNLSLVCHDLGRTDEAEAYARRSLAIFKAGGHDDEPHLAAALAGLAEVCFRTGRHADAVDLYRRALAIIDVHYGAQSDQHAVTAENLAEAEKAAAAEPGPRLERDDTPTEALPAPARTAPAMSGLALARAYWEEHGRPMLDRYPEHRGRIAAGLVGHGSECYGFDDELSRDHDFGPGFCLWLNEADHAAIGRQLQADYEALPDTFLGHGPRVTTTRARGEGRRTGVFEIADFFQGLTGLPSAPPADQPHLWVTLDEATLAAATNGEVFADPYGAFSSVRGGFLRMPDDARLARIGQRLGMIAQAGQYNVPRMLARGDGEAAWLAVSEFVKAAASLVFLLNRPTAVGYLPYYKWQSAALRELAKRPVSRLPGVYSQLADAQRLASAACFGGAGFGEGGAGAGPAQRGLQAAIDDVCTQVVTELRLQRLSTSESTFLEAHRDEVRARIGDPWLRAL
ncbi:tetratricopeptide repeat protein [Demequina zhanjiangensis]|uniref:Tetratricopeptide repeat protein n=1 Tax=Demequina zhanjiangensis TaxID=3051659 RepID=A0ABT8FXA7_9MICO|nr:tetratricopeptide repeat protein [Demequina sp. SYSU T00b26]MDN4471432.1 tetratricopeptide repeat protein [Demequina sp. SYSU T00b26]